jgi:hypothetical protein
MVLESYSCLLSAIFSILDRKNKDSTDGAILVGVKSLDLVEEEGENESDV